MIDETVKRAVRGRFAPGASGNPQGGRRVARTLSPQRLDRLFEKHGPAMLDRAFERFEMCDRVLSALLIFWGVRSLIGAGGSLPAAAGAADQ